MKYIDLLFAQYKMLKTRERVLLLAALLGVAYFAFDFALFRPQRIQARALQEKIAQHETEIEALNKAVHALSAPQQVDPLAKLKSELEGLRSTFGQAESLLAHASTDVRMSDVIRTMVAARPGLTLMSLKTLQSEPIFRGTAAVPVAAPARAAAAGTPTASPALSGGSNAAPAAPLPTLYRHGIEVTIRGSYVTLVPYIRELERNTNGIFWSSVKLDVGNYPEATLRLILFTLSGRAELSLG